MAKLSKHERLQVTYAIDDLLDGYCRAGCPHENHNTPSPVCSTCPVSVLIREHGTKLESEGKADMRNFWTPEEDAILVSSYGKKSVADIAETLGRTTRGIYQRAKLLKDKGLM